MAARAGVLLSRLERRFGKLAVENLTTVIVGGMVLAFVLSYLQPSFAALLDLDLAKVAYGQVWRLVTFLFLPPSMSILWAFFAISITWTVGTSLEAEWGAFKFNLYYLLGALGTIAAALITRESITNYYLNATLFLAFATVFPRYEFRLFFFLPVQVRWLALLDAGLLVYAAVTGDLATRAGIIAAVANYLLFFTGTLIEVVRGHQRQTRSRARLDDLRGGGGGGGGSSGKTEPGDDVARSAGQPVGQRVCAMCGTQEVDGADIRVCSCEKCLALGGARNLCLAHARDH
jgi:hypothetical protein